MTIARSLGIQRALRLVWLGLALGTLWGCARKPAVAAAEPPPDARRPAAAAAAAAPPTAAAAPPTAVTATAAAAGAADLARPATAGDLADRHVPLTTFALPQQAEGAGAAIATAHPLATRAAAQALHRGGSAVDAVVAASFVLSVVTPQSTGIGGGGFAVVAPPTGAPTAWDFREAAPAATRVEDYLGADGKPDPRRSRRHGLAVGVPGMVAGLHALHQRYGKRPWAELLEPAVDAARRGIAVGADLPAAAAAVRSELDASALALLDVGGAPLREGAILVQAAQARTLAAIAARGPAAFYTGEVAADLAASVVRHGGKLTVADLAAYRVREVAPLRGPLWAGLEVLTMPQPSAGGAQLLAMAEFSGAFGLRPRRGRAAAELDTAEAHALVEAMRASFLLRLAYSGDAVRPAKGLDGVYPPGARRSLRARFSPRRASISERIPGTGGDPIRPHGHTSHVSVVDADGMAVSATHTVNLLFGSGIVSGSGVWLNNEMDDFTYAIDADNAFGLAGSAANLARPGARPVSSMTPAIVRDGRGAVQAVIGAPGGTRIPTTVLLVLARTLLRGEPLAAALAAPRLHHQAFPDEVWLEPEAGALAFGLQALGHRTVEKARWCNVQAVVRAGPGWQVASDPRGEGGVMVLAP